MKNLITVLACLIMVTGAFWACTSPSTPAATQITGSNSFHEIQLPQDVYQSCTLSQDSFNSWFQSGHATENGLVQPANSVAFPHNNNCDFYHWSEHMFLWATSPAAGAYNGGPTVMESQLFYDVLPEDSAYKRTLVPHIPGHIFDMSSHLVKNGPNRLPVIKDKAGRLFEIERNERPARQAEVVRNAQGTLTEIGRIERAANGTHSFFDKSGKPIQAPKAVIRHALHRQRIVHEFVANNERVFIDGNGNEIQSEQGQATGDVLMAENRSIVYYLVMVNDVYAYFLTGAKNRSISGATFPTTAMARDSICAYARAQNVVLPDSNALAIELKTSWVEAVNLPNANTYVTADAWIPKYDTTNPKRWVPVGKRKAKMALIGMHVVGSVAHHPEMVWATFEHKSNAPNAAYTYLDVNQKTKTVAQDVGTGWLLSNNSNSAGYDTSYMTSNTINPNGVFAVQSTGDTINANQGRSIQPSNTMRLMPWGSAMDSVTNQEDKSSAASNSEIISINNAIRHMLVGNDIRKNYLLIGATWTDGGAPPNGTSYGADTTAGVAIGTSVLANSTMETYFQSSSSSCLTCHSASNSNSPDSLSHIFAASRPLLLPVTPKSLKK